MKKLILTIAVAVVASQANAQISIAPEVGVNLANASYTVSSPFGGTYSPNSKMKIGVKAGAVVDIPVAGGFFVQPGAFFSMKGTKSTTSLLGVEIKGSYALNYIEVPLNLGYRFDIGEAGNIFVTAGPYLGYAFSGKKTAEIIGGPMAGKTETDVEFGSDNTDDLKPLDFGVNFSAGYQLAMGLYIRAQYGLGLTNLTNSSNTSFKNRVLSFSVGYAFPLGGR